MKATHIITEGLTNRQLANAAMKAMRLIEDCEQGTIRNPCNLASTILADKRTIIQTIYEDGYIRYNDGWHIVEVDGYNIYVDITSYALNELGNPTYEIIDTVNIQN